MTKSRKNSPDADQAGSRSKRAKTKAPQTKTKSPTQAPVTAEPYIVLARKYRPRSFDDLIGQEAMVRTLKNAFALGRIAQAYMLTGVRGVGKTTTARILARALNYSLPDEDTGPTLDLSEEGEHCRAIMESRHVDVIEMDAASHTGIDDIREITEAVRYKPAYARYKVFIIDEVHMLSKAAFNGLLKTLEEPPEHVKFIFATTELRKVPVTVLSRCQRFDLRRVSVEALQNRLGEITAAEGRSAEGEALRLIARSAEGSVRDSLSLLDQALAHAEGEVRAGDVRAMLGLADGARVYDLLEQVFAGDAAGALAQFEALYADGAEPERVLADMAEAVHLITRINIAGPKAARADMAETERECAEALAKRLGVAALSRAWQMLMKGLDEIARAGDGVANAEMLLIRLCYVADLPPPGELAKWLDMGAQAQQSGQTNRERSANESRMQGVSDSFKGSEAQALATSPQPDQDQSAPLPTPRSFAEIAALAGTNRDIKLKIALEEQVELVQFRPGHIELRLLDNASAGLANELGRKLSAWTGERWIISVSDRAGEKPLGQQRREHEAALRKDIERHPLVREVFRHFPDAEITAIRELALPEHRQDDMPALANDSKQESNNEEPHGHDETGQRIAGQDGPDAGRD